MIKRADEHASHVHVHTHATHGHAHGSTDSSYQELALSEIIRKRVISQVITSDARFLKVQRNSKQIKIFTVFVL